MAQEKKRLGALGLTAALVGVVAGLASLALLIWTAISSLTGDDFDALRQALSPGRIFSNINNSSNTDYANSLANVGTVLGIANIAVFAVFVLALLIGLFSLISLLTKGTLGLKLATIVAVPAALVSIVGVTAWFAAATGLNESMSVLGFRYAETGFTLFDPIAASALLGLVVVFTVLRLFGSGSGAASSAAAAPAGTPAAEPASYAESGYGDAAYAAPDYGAHAGLPTPTAVYDAPVSYPAEPASDQEYRPGHLVEEPTVVHPAPEVPADPSPYSPPPTPPAPEAEATRPIGLSGDTPAPAEPEQVAPVGPAEPVTGPADQPAADAGDAAAAQPVSGPAETTAVPAQPAPAYGGSQRPFARAEGEYFLHIGGAEYGPYTAAQVAEFADEGRINEQTQIRPSQGYYEPASVVPGLFG